jgi:D-alanine-D-alanine ligase
MNSNKVALIFGGTSNERLVSVASAQNVVNYFQNPDIYFINPQGQWFPVTADELLSHKNPFVQDFQPKSAAVASDLNATVSLLKGKVSFLALHGTAGEDGTYQEFFEKHQLAYTGSGAKASRLCFNKAKTKEAARVQNMSLASELLVHFDSVDSVNKLRKFFADKKKIVLKPNANGSSFGLFIVSNETELENAITQIKKSTEHDYIVEEFVTGREITVGVWEKLDGIVPLAPSEVLLEAGSNFDYQGKYLGRGSKEITPADLNSVQKKACQDLALLAHKSFGCLGYSRTDMILTANGPVFIETNTLPGMTKASFFPQQLTAENISFQNFIDELLKSGLSRYQKV